MTKKKTTIKKTQHAAAGLSSPSNNSGASSQKPYRGACRFFLSVKFVTSLLASLVGGFNNITIIFVKFVWSESVT